LSATEGLSTLDQFGTRKRVIPAEVSGPLRVWRNRVYGVLLIIFLALPWIKINGLQALLLDIPGRRFEIFGVLFLSHDAPLLFFIMMLLVLALALVTAIWGRVWCGWACPQTVFIDGVYRRIEIWVEGNYLERRKLAAQPMDFTKARKLGLKWFLFFVFSSLFAHSLIAYFAGSTRLLAMMTGPPAENWGYFVLVSVVTAILLFNFGWFREQFCIIMCPYGRFQSVLMDQNTVTVMYDEKRGEPRKGILNTAELRGDCVSCNRCVQVCPTGIDIRNGIQMECIACTACIDACNVIMKKVNKPEGLIRHQRISGAEVSLARPRVLAYSFLAVLLIIGLSYTLAVRKPYSLAILRATDAPYQVLQDGKVMNHFKAHIMNQSTEDQEFEISLAPKEIQQGVQLTQAKALHPVGAGGSAQTHFFIIFPQSRLSPKGATDIQVLVRERKKTKDQIFEVKGIGPYSSGS